MTTSDVAGIFEFSGFRMDSGRRELTSPDGSAVSLPTKAFDVLAWLVDNPGRLVDKDELLSAVWPGVAVEENTLNHAISAVRRALGDSRNEHRFIATIQGRGYQFVAPVRVVASDQDPGAGADRSAGPVQASDTADAAAHMRFDRGQWGIPGIISGALILVVGVLSLAAYVADSRSTADAAIEYAVGGSAWLTRDSALELDPAISPDGRLVAYTAGPIGYTDIVVRDTVTGRTRNLTEGLPGAHVWPRWDPDSARIAFRTILPDSADIIHVMPAEGGDAIAVVREPFLTGHDWSPTGNEIVFARASNLYVYSFPDGAYEELPVNVPEVHSPSWSPDGAGIAVVSGNNAYMSSPDAFGNIAPSAIWVVSADGLNVRHVTDSASMNTSPVWAPDSRSLLFLSDRDGALALYQVGLAEAGEMQSPPWFLTHLDAHTMSLSSDGRQLVYSELIISNANIWSLPIPDAAGAPFSPTLDMATQITHGTQKIEGIDVSSDGQWLLFDSSLSGNQDIYKMALRNGEPVGDPIQLTFDWSDDFAATWSPDASEIAFHSFRNGNRDIFVMSADGERSGTGPVALTTDIAEERFPDWSRDGNRIAFFSDKTGIWQSFILSRSGPEAGWSGPEQLTYSWGYFAKWSPTENLIAITALEGVTPTIAVLTPYDKNPTTFDLGAGFEGSYPVWATDGSRIYFKLVSYDGVGIWSIRPDGSGLTELISFDELSLSGYPRLEFAASDTHFYFTLREQDSNIRSLELVESGR